MEKDYFERQLTCEEAREFSKKFENDKLDKLKSEIENVIKINENIILDEKNRTQNDEFFNLYESKINELQWVLERIKQIKSEGK